MAITKKTVAPKQVPDAVIAAPGIPKFALKAVPEQDNLSEGASDAVVALGLKPEGSGGTWAVDALKATVHQAEPALDPLAAEIDALGNMESSIKAMQTKIAEYSTRVSVVRDKLVAAGELTVVGNDYYALVKETGNKVRKVKDMPLAVKHLGVDTFLKVAKIGLADIDKYLNEAQKAEVIETTESLTRSMKILKRV